MGDLEDKKAESHDAYLERNREFEDSREIIEILRLYRHDFLNHLQVITGFIQLNRPDNALNYINEVVDALKKQSLISNMEHPEVASLLFKKMYYAEREGIRFTVEPGSNLRGLDIPASVISGIIGNLVDNALYAARNLPPGEDRTVEIAFGEDNRCFFIEVWYKRPVIPPELQEKVFRKNFTTKGSEGTGFGLFIVKELAEAHGGTVELTSNEEEGTVFTFTFPKAKTTNL
ncbi:sensor histidine kinase [Thermincola ferriacetica]